MSTTKRNWSKYNEMKTRRFQLFASLLVLLLDMVPLPSLWSGRGRHPLPLRDMIIACAIKIYFKVSYRDTVSLLREYKELFRISHIPHFNTIRNYMINRRLTAIFATLIVLTVLPLTHLETTFAQDATGMGMLHKSEYYIFVLNGRKMSPQKKCRKRGFVKLHIAIGTKTQMVVGVVGTKGEKGDVTQLPKIIRAVAKLFVIAEWICDSGYLARYICNIIAKFQGVPYIWPKKNSTIKQRGSKAWGDMMRLFKNNIELFKKRYHQRSKVESVYSVIKRYFGDTVCSKIYRGQINEMILKVLAYNLCRLGQIKDEMKIELPKEYDLGVIIKPKPPPVCQPF